MAASPNEHGLRASFSTRISSLFERRRMSPQMSSGRNTATFEVPLFLSPTRYRQPQVHDEEDMYEANAHFSSSTRSLVDAAAPFATQPPPLTIPASSRYSSPASSPHLTQYPDLPTRQPLQISSSEISRSGATATTHGKRSTQQHRRRRRRPSTRRRIQGLRRIAAVFGLTLLVTLVTYLVLAVTGAAAGVMFHVLMVLFILALTGVVTHSIIRVYTLSRRAKTKRTEPRQIQHWSDQQPQSNGMFFGQVSSHVVDHNDQSQPEKPIQVIMAVDEEAALEQRPGLQPVKYPPPVYGNFRTSKRINPNLLHWRKVPPSPLTPTYDEAMSDAHRALGYRPPSYVESDGGVTQIVERGRQDVDRALQDIHPLERERMVRLGRNAI